MAQTALAVPGLQYHPHYLLPREQEQLLTLIDAQPWLTELKRRVQHYGYRYNYSRRTVGAEAYLGPLPDWVAVLAHRLHHDGYGGQAPDQVIINDYQPGQGIAGHVDCIPCFGQTILSLSLGSACPMVFTRLHATEQVSLWVEPGSLVVMQGDARFAWKHSIPARKADTYQGQRMERERRVSLTFRTVTHHPIEVAPPREREAGLSTYDLQQ